jgi:glycosyltransferase involved in cell wall biosynthesis
VREKGRLMPPAPRLSVVIPVYNEESIVRESCQELMARLDERGWDYEVLVTENVSKDRTVEILRALSAEAPRLRAIHSDQPNYGLALRRGILEATGLYVVTDEIDLCDVRFYDRALAILDAGGADMVVGSKRAPGSQDRRPAYRRLATAVHNTVLRFTLGFEGTDTHGLKAFVRAPLLPIARAAIVEKDVFASEFVIRAYRAGLRVREIPVRVLEKRTPSINLVRRVPNVLKSLAKLTWAIRVKG